MGLATNTINETEQAGEKLTDKATVGFLQIVQKVFDCLWQTKFTFEIGRKDS